MFSKNVLTILGVVFTAVGGSLTVAGAVCLFVAPLLVAAILGGIGAIFTLIGVLSLTSGLKRGRRRIAALMYGVPAEGEIVSVRLDTSETINNRNPWSIEYAFDVNGVRQTGRVQSWSHSDGERKAGEPVWVVYLVDDVSDSTIWPPLS
jgi:hypothetical protein